MTGDTRSQPDIAEQPLDAREVRLREMQHQSRGILITEPYRISCAVCGKACKWIAADPDADAPSKFGGWYCEPCDIFSETDVE